MIWTLSPRDLSLVRDIARVDGDTLTARAVRDGDPRMLTLTGTHVDLVRTVLALARIVPDHDHDPAIEDFEARRTLDGMTFQWTCIHVDPTLTQT